MVSKAQSKRQHFRLAQAKMNEGMNLFDHLSFMPHPTHFMILVYNTLYSKQSGN
jgi:hypothetical protein